MKRLLLLVAVALALPAAAAAKGPVSAELCGPDDCRALGELSFGHAGLFDVSRAEDAPTPGPYYELRLDFGGGRESSGIYYEPRSGLVSYAEDYGFVAWAPLNGTAPDPQGLRPYPAPRVTAVRVGDRPLEGDLSSYLRLVSTHGPFVLPKTTADGERIQVETSYANPWTGAPLLYYAEDDVLSRNGTFVKLPADLAWAIEGAGSRPTTLPLLPAGVSVVGLVAMLWLRSRRARAVPEPADLRV